jgi:hypothetical protein
MSQSQAPTPLHTALEALVQIAQHETLSQDCRAAVIGAAHQLARELCVDIALPSRRERRQQRKSVLQ